MPKVLAAQLVAHGSAILFSQIVKKYQIFFLLVLNTLSLNMNCASHWRITVLSFSEALLNDDTSTLNVFFDVVLVIIVVGSLGESEDAC